MQSVHLSDAHTHHLNARGRLTCLCSAQASDWASIETAATQAENIIPFYGIHPWYLYKLDFANQLALLEKKLMAQPRAGVGEIGLDKTSKKSTDFAFQKEAFESQLRLAHQYHRPISVHCVKAWGTLKEQLKSQPSLRVIIHGWNGSLSPKDFASSADFLLSVGWREFLNKPETINSIPLEHLALESDNSEAPISELYEAIASHLRLTPTELCQITENNLKRLLCLA